MDKTTINQHATKIMSQIKGNEHFPFATGRLKNNATYRTPTLDGFVICINGTIAPYAEYLQNGTKPHNIPRAFGRPLPFGTSGNFDKNGERLPPMKVWEYPYDTMKLVPNRSGYFHPGSKKHQGWIDYLVVGTALSFFYKEKKRIEKQYFTPQQIKKFKEN